MATIKNYQMLMRYLTGFCLLMSLVVWTACSNDSDDTDTIGNWVHRVDFRGVARTHAVSFTILDTAFVGTGADDDNDTLRDFYSYDADRDTWTQRASLPDGAPARHSAAAFSIGGKGYVGTGTDGDGNYMKDFYAYNPDGNRWEPVAPIPQAPGTDKVERCGAVGFAVQNRGYIATGYNGSWMNDTWEYNPATNSWDAKDAVPLSKRADAVAFVIQDKAYIVTGQNNQMLNNELSMFDPATGRWSLKRAITNVSDEDYDDEYNNITGYDCAAFVMNNKAYVCTGTRGSISGVIWEYDAVNDLWDLKEPFEGAARSGAVAFSIKNRGYIATGSSGSVPLSDTWEFQPDVEVNKND